MRWEVETDKQTKTPIYSSEKKRESLPQKQSKKEKPTEKLSSDINMFPLFTSETLGWWLNEILRWFDVDQNLSPKFRGFCHYTNISITANTTQ